MTPKIIWLSKFPIYFAWIYNKYIHVIYIHDIWAAASRGLVHGWSRTGWCVMTIKRNSLSQDPNTQGHCLIFLSLTCGDCVVDPTDCARNLGVIFDKCPSFRPHISSVVRSASLGLRNIGRIRKYLTVDTARTYYLKTWFFSNSLLVNLPSATIRPLQRVQNSAARLVTGTRKSEHITPVPSRFTGRQSRYALNTRFL
jgi:hypothetical protein